MEFSTNARGSNAGKPAPHSIARKMCIHLVSAFVAVALMVTVGSDVAFAAKRDEILIIFNHGSSKSDGRDCYSSPYNRRPMWLNDIDNKMISGLKVTVITPCTGYESGRFPTRNGCGSIWVCQRAEKIVDKIKEAIAEGYQPKNIFVGGQSAGGWASLLIKRWNPGLFNGVIATAPAFNGRRRSRLCSEPGCKIEAHWKPTKISREIERLWKSKMRRQHDKRLGLGSRNPPVLRALVFAFQCDPFGHPSEYPFSGNRSVKQQIFPREFANIKDIECAVSDTRYRHYQSRKKPGTQRCLPIKEPMKSNKLRCGPGVEARFYGQIRNCPPELSEICGTYQHAGVQRGRAFRDYVVSSGIVEHFIAAHLKNWKPVRLDPEGDSPCSFIKYPAICQQESR